MHLHSQSTAPRPRRRLLISVAVAVIGFASAVRAEPPPSPPPPPPPPPPTQEDLLREIRSLRREVDALKSARATPAYTAREVDTTVDGVVRDADRRSRLLADSGGFYGGFLDDRFQIRSADGNFSMSPSVWFQFRQVTNYRQDVNASGDDQTDNGFELRRAKFGIDGNAFGKDFYYNFVWATDRKSGNLVLEEGYGRYQFADNFAVKFGSYKELWAWESGVSSRRKLAVDVSLLDSILFGADTYTQGVELNYDDKNSVQAALGFTDGHSSVNTNFQDPPTNGFDFGVEGRVQYKAFGDWRSYADFTALGNKKDLLVVGLGGNWSQNGDQNVVRYSLDAQYETGPLGAFAGFYGRYTDDQTAGSAFDWGFIAQAGWLFNQQWELFGRYDYLKLDTDTAAGEDTYHEVTVGMNYYIHKHNLKFTIDGTWLPNGAPTNQDGIGVLANDGNNEFMLRAQIQFFI